MTTRGVFSARRVPLPDRLQVQTERIRLQRFERRMRACLCILAVGLFLYLFFTVLVVLFFPVLRVRGNSMQPILKENDYVLMLRTDHAERGDLCAFQQEDDILIRRIVGVGSDLVTIDDNAILCINGERLAESTLSEESLYETVQAESFSVPQGSYCVLSQNSDVTSEDTSVEIGCMEASDLLGRVLFRVYPLTGLQSG